MQERGKPLPIETLPRQELERIQNRRLAYTLEIFRKESSFIHGLFRNNRIKPGDIRSKSDLLKAYSEKDFRISSGLLVNNPEHLLTSYARTHFSQPLWSSSLGRPKVVWYTKDSLKAFTEEMSMMLRAIGAEPGDKILGILAPPPFSSGTLTREACKENELRLLELMVPMPIQYWYKVVNEFEPHYLFTSPKRALEIWGQLRQSNIPCENLFEKGIVVGGEASSKELKGFLGEEFDCEIFDVLGLTEGLFCYECRFHEGLHIPETRFIVSCVDPETRKVLDDGEEGHVMITPLYEEGETPGTCLFNYITGDVASILPSPCECGQTFKRLGYPKKEEEMMVMDGAKLYAGSLQKVVVAYISDGLTGKYTVVEHKDKALKTINSYEVKIQVHGEASSGKQGEILSKMVEELTESNPPAFDTIQKWVTMGRFYIKFEGLEKYSEFERTRKPTKDKKLISIEDG